MPVLLLTEDDVRRLLTMDLPLSAVEEGLKKTALDEVQNVPRARTQTDHAMLHVMSASAKSLGYMGYKAYTTGRKGSAFARNVCWLIRRSLGFSCMPTNRPWRQRQRTDDHDKMQIANYCSKSRICTKSFFVRRFPSRPITITFWDGRIVSPEMMPSACAADVLISRVLFAFSGISTVHEN